jgi:hypothetical protein
VNAHGLPGRRHITGPDGVGDPGVLAQDGGQPARITQSRLTGHADLPVAERDVQPAEELVRGRVQQHGVEHPVGLEGLLDLARLTGRPLPAEQVVELGDHRGPGRLAEPDHLLDRELLADQPRLHHRPHLAR